MTISLEFISIAIAIFSLVLSYLSSRRNLLDHARTVEQRSYVKDVLGTVRDELEDDLNGLGQKVNSIVSRIELIEYKISELKGDSNGYSQVSSQCSEEKDY
jgi:sensor domain CHASE-containing protein